MAALVSFSQLGFPSTGHKFLDLVITKSAVVLENAAEFEKGQAYKNWKVPLLGFEYTTPDTLPLLAYRYSEYPFLNKQVIKSCLNKESVKFNIQGINNRIFGFGGVFLNFGFNESVRNYLDRYILKGGLFTIITAWGIIKHCVCENIAGKKLNSQDAGGQCMIFSFSTAQIDTDDITSQLSESLKGLGF